MILENKIVGVTGAGAGIGRAIAKAMAAEGARVAVTDINPDTARQVAEEIKAHGQEAIALEMDVRNRRQIEDAVRSIVSKWGKIDVWCNNAGVSSMKPFIDLTEEEWNFNIDTNAKGVFFCSQIVARQMIKQDTGPRNGLRAKIINTASMAGKRGNATFLAHYVASKFAVIGLTQATAGELAPYGITVNAVCPGYVRTSMQEREVGWESTLRSISQNEVRQLYVNDTPLGRLETADDVAAVVVFLASPASDFITGEAISINGGSYMD
ncbi:MAG: SDR family NAD(P)-dependent oxidoreductase [Anaerolineales bacterium]|jgi:NAD(P)-dependent dehydrogenase (short-subunit alcohol dehydrogenase family)